MTEEPPSKTEAEGSSAHPATTTNHTTTKTSPAPSLHGSNKSVRNGVTGPQASNGTLAPPPATANAGTPEPKKSSLTGRITRMFSSTPKPKEETHAIQSSSGGSDSDGSTKKSDKQPARPTMGARRPSRTGSMSKDKKRFELLPDGNHVHHLKGTKRQEKLTNIFKELMGGGRRKEHDPDEKDRLSLVENWADQVRREKDKLSGRKSTDMERDKKGGANSATTLVEKYGKCQEVIGRGAFGIVRISHKVDKNGHSEKLFAVKEFRRRPDESTKKYQKRLTSEFCISSSLVHHNIIQTLDLLQDAKGDYCEVMEFCAGGDLYTLVLAAGKLEVAEADCYFKQLMRAVEYMHDMGVAHRDLKPENLLLTTNGTLKITDFGNGECFRMAWETEAHLATGLCGSAPYIAPEEYTDKEFDPRAVDVWATGVIYMAMRTGRHLWRVAKKDEDEFFQKYLEGRKDEEGYGPIETLKRVCCKLVIRIYLHC